jgi:hypothetical protein
VCLSTISLFGGVAGAATSTETYGISGTLTIGPPPSLTLPAGSSITFTLDDETGAITNGQTSIPTFDRGAVSGPQAFITLTDAAPATGSIDPATGHAQITLTLAVGVDVPALSASCSLGDTVTVSLSTSNPGGSALAGDPPTGVLTATGISVPGVAASTGCELSVADVINDLIDLPTADTSFTLSVSRASSVTSSTTASTSSTSTSTTVVSSSTSSVPDSTATTAVTAVPPTAPVATLPATGQPSTMPFALVGGLLVVIGLGATRLVRRPPAPTRR